MTTRAKRKKNNGHTDEIVIPGKLYFRIGEVAELCKLPAYVLRFWESEFPQLHPGKSSTGQRLYRRRDVENVVRIKRLLYDEGYTISGARQFLKAQDKNGRSQAALPFSSASNAELRAIRQQMKELLTLLSTRRPN